MASSSLSAPHPLLGPMKALADNPLDFLKKNPIQFDTSIVPQEYLSDDRKTFRSRPAGVKLVKFADDGLKPPKAIFYKLRFVARKDMPTDKEAITAYVLGSTPNRGNDDVQFVEMPAKTCVDDTFMFTVDLSGCSVVATRLDGNTYRVFHDIRMDSTVLYNNVQMCVNFDDYRTGSFYLSRTGYAFICMQSKAGKWKMFLQRQLPDPEKPKQIPEVHAYAVKKMDPPDPASLERVFNDRRAVLQNRVKASARTLKVDANLIANARDGVVRGVEYDEEAIRAWKALRKAIKDQVAIDEAIKAAAKAAAAKAAGKAEADIVDPSKETYVRFKNDVSASEDMDVTWIWLQVKKNRARAQHQRS